MVNDDDDLQKRAKLHALKRHWQKGTMAEQKIVAIMKSGNSCFSIFCKMLPSGSVMLTVMD